MKALFDAQSDIPHLSAAQRKELIAAIGKAKILDPACGSGAYPMGALHRLVDLLQKLDPNNEGWKRDRLAEAEAYLEILRSADAKKEELAECEGRIEEIRHSFDTRFHALDFARKLYLIENCIYGIDIQPIACQIAKLRFFIALIVDQHVDRDAKNLGVRPLPNLETKIVAADALMPIDKPAGQRNLFDAQLRPLLRDLERVRHEHFDARTPAKKAKCRARDEELRAQIAEVIEEAGMPTESAHKLAAWDPYDQNHSAGFFDPEWMFGLPVGKIRRDGAGAATLTGRFGFVNSVAGQKEFLDEDEVDSGFDIVFGNPPYVRHEKIKDQKAAIKPHYPDTFSGTADLYVYFYDRALQLLRPEGVLCYISSNKWYRAAYGEKLRGYLAKTTMLLHAIDFGDAPVFTAIAYPTIVVARKVPPPSNHAFRALNWDPETPNTEISNFAKFYETKAGRVVQSSLALEGWRFLAKKARDLLDKIRAAGKPLGEFVGGRFFYGIKTGLNDAFVVDRATRDRLIAEHESSAELLKPFLRGRDVKRWRCDWQDLWLVFVPWHCPIQEDPSIVGCSLKAEKLFAKKYPAIYRHLSRFKGDLAARNQAETGIRYEWYALQRWAASYSSEFLNPKIVYPNICQRNEFAWDETGAFTNQKTFIIPGAPKYLLAVLNSAVVMWLFTFLVPKLQNEFYEPGSKFLSEFPIPCANSEQRPVCEGLVEIMTLLSGPSVIGMTHPRDPLMCDYYEELLNALVYELYLPEELHAAGLQVFDLVEAADLPKIAAGAKAKPKEQLARLRDKFEELYAPIHPLRAALQKLHALESVRIIEGKA